MKVIDIQLRLLLSGFDLCGSRFLGTHKENSDWDSVVSYSVEAIDLLIRLGFEPIEFDRDDLGDEYEKIDNSTVYELKVEDGKIQVAVIDNQEFKMAIMIALKNNDQLRELDMSLKGKPQRNQLWKTLFELARFMPAGEAL